MHCRQTRESGKAQQTAASIFHRRPIAFREMDFVSPLAYLSGERRRDDPGPRRRDQRCAHFHHRHRQRCPAEALRRMDERHFVVAAQVTIAVGAVDAPDSDHAVAVELGCPQRAHARGAEYLRARCHKEQQLLVPRGGATVEQAVDQADLGWRVFQQRQDVSRLGRRSPVEAVVQAVRGQERRPGKDYDRSHVSESAAVAGASSSRVRKRRP